MLSAGEGAGSRRVSGVGRSSAAQVRICKKIVLESTKYCIGVLTRIPVSIGNILEYWIVSDPTKYWNILEILIPGAGISSWDR